MESPDHVNTYCKRHAEQLEKWQKQRVKIIACSSAGPGKNFHKSKIHQVAGNNTQGQPCFWNGVPQIYANIE